MMEKQKDYKHSNKAKNSQKQHEEPWQPGETWLGNPDDHEPTRKVERDEVNP